MEAPRGRLGEGARKAAHVATLLAVPFFAHLPTEILLLTTGSLSVLCVVIGPSVFARLARPGEGWKRMALAVGSFPLGALLLLAAFPEDRSVAAGAIAVLAAGDAAAGWIGRRARGRRLPWHPEKTIAGSAAFIAAALPVSVLAHSYVSGAGLGASAALLLPAVLVGALVESIPTRFGDNLPVLLFTGFLLGQAACSHDVPWEEAARRLGPAIASVLLLSLAGVRAGAFGRAGAAAGALLGGAVFVALGWSGFALMALFVVAGSAASRAGAGKRSPRGARHAVANLGLPAFLALLAFLGGGITCRAAFAGALAAAMSDTLAGEIGMRRGGTPRLIIDFRRVPTGTDGGITTLGTAAGAAGALLVASASVWTGLLPRALLWPIAAAGFGGNLVDSFLGATVEKSGGLGNEEVNFLATLAGALLAALGASIV